MGFRYYSVHKARQLGLAGWVQNLYDGSVEMEVQGTEEKIDELILFLERQRYIEITNMDVKTQPLKEERTFMSGDIRLLCFEGRRDRGGLVTADPGASARTHTWLWRPRQRCLLPADIPGSRQSVWD